MPFFLNQPKELIGIKKRANNIERANKMKKIEFLMILIEMSTRALLLLIVSNIISLHQINPTEHIKRKNFF